MELALIGRANSLCDLQTFDFISVVKDARSCAYIVNAVQREAETISSTL